MSDLIELAAIEGDGAQEHLATVYEWRHGQRVAQGKALAAAGLSVVLAIILPIVQPDSSRPVEGLAIAIALGSAGVLLVAGAIVFYSAASLHREYIMAQALLEELKTVRGFLKLYRTRR